MEDLWQRVCRVSDAALASGALESIPTQALRLEERGVQFMVRVLDTLKRKDEAARRLKAAGDTHHDPFLPPEAALTVGPLGDSHLCVLNKFNVVDHHLLIVTRAFEPQRNWINRRDFSALAQCLAQIDGLGFYNGGALAGASQLHKHLQLIPLPMAPFAPLPFSPQLARLSSEQPEAIPGLLFRHAALRFNEGLFADAGRAADQLMHSYAQLLVALGIEQIGEQQSQDYNLLVTRRWMLLVPRTAERCEGISLNALAFSGALLVRRPEQVEQLQRFGLMRALQSVT